MTPERTGNLDIHSHAMVGLTGMTLKVLSTLAVQGAMPTLAARYEQSTGNKIETHFAPTMGLLARIAAGETADIAILTRSAVDELAGQGVLVLDSRVDIARSLVGIAVRTGAPRPDIGSVEALKSALLNANSIAYSKIGASGLFFADLIARLGIVDEIDAKTTIIPSGFTAELAARGEVELAVQQISELMMVPGVDIVGPLPAGAESVTMFSAGMFARSANAPAARHLLGYLRSADAAPALTAAGLEPASER